MSRLRQKIKNAIRKQYIPEDLAKIHLYQTILLWLYIFFMLGALYLTQYGIYGFELAEGNPLYQYVGVEGLFLINLATMCVLIIAITIVQSYGGKKLNIFCLIVLFIIAVGRGLDFFWDFYVLSTEWGIL